MNPTVSDNSTRPQSRMCHWRVRVSSVENNWFFTYTPAFVSVFMRCDLPALV